MNYEYCDGITHTIKQGENLYNLSRYYKIPLAILLRANPYIDVYNLKVGDTICVPVKNTGIRNQQSMNINTSVPENTSSDMTRDMPENTSIPENNDSMDMNMNMPMGVGMGLNMENADNTNADIADNSKGDISSKENENCWIKYVAQSGDTLQDIFDRSACSKEMFWEKNSADRMYVLPGVAYFIFENNIE